MEKREKSVQLYINRSGKMSNFRYYRRLRVGDGEISAVESVLRFVITRIKLPLLKMGCMGPTVDGCLIGLRGPGFEPIGMGLLF